MSNLSKQNPLFLPVQYQGELYFTSQYFHQQYHANKPEGGKYSKLADFNRLIRSIETYQNYVDRSDIIDLEYKPLKALTDALFAPVKEIFKASNYNPIMLINATAQIALTHHLDDEVSKSISVAANESTAKRQPKNSLAPMKDAVWFLKEAAKMLRMSETSVNRGMQVIAEAYDLPNNTLPAYSMEGLTKCLGDLLKDHGVNLSAVAANKILEKLGYIQSLERRSTGNTVKTFKSITESGLEFGRNETPPESPNQTQPRWYVAKFSELAVLITNGAGVKS